METLRFLLCIFGVINKTFDNLVIIQTMYVPLLRIGLFEPSTVWDNLVVSNYYIDDVM